MRCPYCRLIMADTDARCVRCGAVDQGGRWVRGGKAPGAIPPRPKVDPVDVPLDAPMAPPVGSRTEPAGSPGRGASPSQSPPPVVDRESSGRGCLVVAAVIVVVFIAVVIGGVVAVVIANENGSSSSSGSSPATVAPSAWSLDAEARFEAACLAGGTDADSCRCVRRELEQRFTEQQVDAMIAVLDRGDPLSASIEGQLRDAERACGAG